MGGENKYLNPSFKSFLTRVLSIYVIQYSIVAAVSYYLVTAGKDVTMPFYLNCIGIMIVGVIFTVSMSISMIDQLYKRGSLPVINFIIFTISLTGLWALISLANKREYIMIFAFMMLGMSIGLLFYSCVMKEYNLCCSFLVSCIFITATVAILMQKFPKEELKMAIYISGAIIFFFALIVNIAIKKMLKDPASVYNKRSMYPGINYYIFGVFCFHNCIIDLTMSIFDE